MTEQQMANRQAIDVTTLVLWMLTMDCSGGWIGGIHATLRYRPAEHTLLIERVPANGAAAHAGLREHDEVLAIDGTAVSSMTEEEIRLRLRGEVGTRVRLGILRDGLPRDILVERAPYRR